MIGKTISHYQILEEIGRGGMGEVYLAQDLDLERQVAIKFLPKDLTRNDENVERFKREARAAATLNHPNIITIYEIAVSEGEYFIVMEYVKGETLRHKMDREKKLSLFDINSIIEQLGQGLDKAHQAGIVHRDIKPENIFINEDGRVKILDFGLAKLLGSRNLTKDLSTLGTIRYISPEQARGVETSSQSGGSSSLKYLYWSIPIIVILVAIFLFSLNRTSENLDQLMIDVFPMIEKGDYESVYDYFVNSGIETDDIIDTELFDQIAGYLSIDSNPQNASISLARIRYKPRLHLDSDISPGETPLIEQTLIAGEYHLRLSLSETESIGFIIEVNPNDSLRIFRSVGPAGFFEEEMIFVEAGKTFEEESVPAFYIDIYEVTNEQYFAFMSEGGYRLSHLWSNNMVIKKSVVSQSAALKSFVDQTGIPAPRHWSGGKYPVGSELKPVTGVSWYEANAYAAWAGKQLPDWKQWWRAAVDADDRIYPWGNDVKTISERANFGSIAVRAVGSFPFGVSPFGCLDMAGNVNEWLRDSNGLENPARTAGGSWQNPSYMFEPTHAQPFHRDYSSADIGFRCIKSVKKE